MTGEATALCSSAQSIRSSMVRSLLCKAAALALTLLIVSVMTFCAFSAVKGEGALMTLGTQGTAERVQERRKELGTDKSLAAQYALWIAGLLHGDMGVSFRYKQSVSTLILHALPATLCVGGLSFLLAIAAGIPLGAITAYTKGAAGEALRSAVLLGLSIPEFFLSVIVICAFSLALHLFVPGAAGGASVFFAALVIATPQAAILSKFVCSAITAERAQLYVRTVRGRGASDFYTLFRHILPNALVSLLPLAAMMAANIFTGSVIVEQVFGIAGVGRLLVGAVLFRDLPLCRALVLCIACVTAVLNFAVDAMAKAADTRIRL